MNDIVFAGRISKQGIMKVIVIPKKLHKQIKNIDGQVIVKLNLITK